MAKQSEIDLNKPDTWPYSIKLNYWRLETAWQLDEDALNKKVLPRQRANERKPSYSPESPESQAIEADFQNLTKHLLMINTIMTKFHTGDWDNLPDLRWATDYVPHLQTDPPPRPRPREQHMHMGGRAQPYMYRPPRVEDEIDVLERESLAEYDRLHGFGTVREKKPPRRQLGRPRGK